MSPVIQFTSIDYPETDGKPMGETDLHRDEMVREIELLRRYFEGQQVYVSGDLLVYYVQGNPKRFVVPDVFVVKGIDPEPRRIYKTWVERQVPNVIIEVTSRKTKKTDTVTKPKRYCRLGVKEYFVFDPTQDYLDPPLHGYRLVGDKYVRIAADPQGRLVSDELGLRLQVERRQLAMFRSATGQRLLTEREARQAAESKRVEAERERQVEAEARRAAEAEVARLREELRRHSAT